MEGCYVSLLERNERRDNVKDTADLLIRLPVTMPDGTVLNYYKTFLTG